MYEEVASLPPPDPASLQQPLPDLAKRPWETSKTGYLQWAVGQSLAHSGGDGAQGASVVSRVAEVVQAVGTTDQVKSASQSLEQPERTTR